MTDATPVPPAAIAAPGHNNPPLELPADDTVKTYLTAKHGEHFDRFRELEAAAKTVPKKIKDEEMSGKVGDLVGQFRALYRALEGGRTSENAPVRKLLALVDGFFNVTSSKAEVIAKDLKARNEEFLKDLEARRRAEAARKEAEAKRARDKALKEAADAEAKRKKAEDDRLKAEADAQAARDRADEENRRAAAAIQAREKAEREAREAQQRQADEQTRREAEERVAAAKRQEEEARQREDAARDQEERATKVADKAGAVEDKHQATVDATMGVAIGHDRTATKARRTVGAKASALTRVRGDLGSVTSLKTVWKVDALDKDVVDLEVLRPYLATDDVIAAANRFVAAGGRKLKGATIIEDRDAVGHRG